jgi:hypothetical protein
MTKSSVARVWVLGLAAVGATIWLVWPGLQPRDGIPAFERLIAAAETVVPASASPTIPVSIPGLHEGSLGFYLPPELLDSDHAVPSDLRLRVCVFARQTVDGGQSMQINGPPAGRIWDVSRWAKDAVWTVEDTYRIACIAGRTTDTGLETMGERALVFWSPDPSAVAVTPAQVEDFLRSRGARFLEIWTRYQVKLNVYGRLSTAILIGETRADQVALRDLVRDAQDHFGGKVVWFHSDP